MSVNSQLINIPKPVDEGKQYFDIFSKGLDVFRKGVKVAVVFSSNVPQELQSVAKITGITSGVSAVFNGIKAVNEAAFVVTSKKVSEKVDHAWKSAMSASRIMLDTKNLVDALKVTGTVAKGALPWLSELAKFFYPFQVIAFMLETYEYGKLCDFYLEFRERVSVVKHDREKLAGQIEWVQANTANIERSFSIGKRSKTSEKVDALMQRLKDDADVKAIQDTEKFLEAMKFRATTKVVLSSSKLITSLAKTIMLPFTLFVPATPVTVGISAGLSVADLGHMVAIKALELSDPYSEGPVTKTRYAIEDAKQRAKVVLQDAKEAIETQIETFKLRMAQNA